MRKLYDLTSGVVFSPDEPAGGTVTDEEISEFLSDDTPTEESAESGEGGEETPPGEGGESEEEGGKPTEEPPSDEPKGDAGTGEEGKVEPKGGEATPAATPVVDEEPKDELSLLRKQVETLQGLVNDLAGTKSKPAEAPTEEVPQVTVDAMLESMDFDDVMKDKESFVKFLVQYANVIKTEAAQQTLTSIPSVVGSVVHRQTSLREVANAFYATHPELKPVKQYVGRVANEISAAEPELTIQQVLDKAAIKVKETLNLQAIVQAQEKKAAGKPSLPGGSRGAKGKTGPSTGLQSEIDEFITD
jgi:hypothetical protein